MLRLGSLVVIVGCLLAGPPIHASQAVFSRALAGDPDTPDWRSTLGRAVPDHERLAVVAEDGRVLAVVDGDRTQVHLPRALADLLSTGAMRVTLVHNHPSDRGFSCADLRQLSTRGVIAVVALGSAGSVFEAAPGARYDDGFFEEAACRRRIAAVADELAGEVGYGFSDRSELADQVPHLLAEAFGRLGVIDYRLSPAIQARIALSRHRLAFERVTTRVTRDLARQAPPRLARSGRDH